MSTQSGIPPTCRLISAFKAFVADEEPLLTAHIINETVDLKETFKGQSLESALSSMKDTISDSEAQYIFIKSESGEKSFTFVAYVPDYATVKDKMLYASSKNNLIRSLGSEYFSHVLFWNDINEVDYQNWVQTITTDSAAISKSNEEKELEKIREMELDTLAHSTSTRKQLVSHSNEFSFRFHDNTQGLDLNENEVLSFNIDLPTEMIFLSNTSKIATPKDIIEVISPSYPQFTVLKYNSSVFFIYSCPSGSKVKERMVYASNKQGFIRHFEKQFSPFAKSIEIGDPTELELSEIEQEDGATKKDTNMAFSRPSRPGRRR